MSIEELSLKPVTNWVVVDFSTKEGRDLLRAALKHVVWLRQVLLLACRCHVIDILLPGYREQENQQKFFTRQWSFFPWRAEICCFRHKNLEVQCYLGSSLQTAVCSNSAQVRFRLGSGFRLVRFSYLEIFVQHACGRHPQSVRRVSRRTAHG